MTTEQTKIVDKIRALFSKTVDNGCTEAEALAALDKARALMDAYEVTEEDLALTRAESAIFKEDNRRDPHSIRAHLAMAVAEFSSCTVWKNREGGMTFCGLRSDADMATWLLESLAAFVLTELTQHLMGRIDEKRARRLAINGFTLGCTYRVSERLKALCRQSAQVAPANSRALTVVKGAAVAELMTNAGIHLGGGRKSRRQVSNDSYSAGRSAGDRASFGRPVGGSAQSMIGN